MPTPSQSSDRTITLVGAGLVGSLLSIHLARRGYQVEIHERRPDMRKERISAGRSINLAISTRGLAALDEVGLRVEALKNAVPMKGRMMHPVRGELAYQAYGKDDSQYINSISRAWLNKRLMTAAEETGRVRIHFQSRATHYDPKRGSLTVRDERSGAESENQGVVIGTDGSASVIRQALTENAGRAASQVQLEHGYKELVIPPTEAGGFRMEKNALHIWPRGTYMLIALPNLDGSFTATLFLPDRGPVSFESLKTSRDVSSFFREHFPDSVELIPSLETDFFANPTGHMVTIRCTPWHHGGQALLVGDAAHAIVPFFGQGMNCGFEDCSIFSRLLDRHGSDWTAVFDEFSSSRKPDADAIADMAVENFVEMRDRVADPRFLLEKKVEGVLQREFPGYISRYAMVSFSRVPYRVAYRAGAVQAEILAELCAKINQVEELDLGRARALVEEKWMPFRRGNIDGLQNQG